MAKLSSLRIGTKAKIKFIEGTEQYKRQLMDLGIVKGSNIKKVFKSPLNDPVAYEIKGSIFALRKEDSSKIEVY